MYFDYLCEETVAAFETTAGFKQIALPDLFAKNRHAEVDGELVLENRFYRLEEWGDLRIAHTYAPKINIVAVFFFPEPEWQLPVYSMEFVLLGDKPIIALMDMACLLKSISLTQTVKEIMDSAHVRFPEFASNQPLPDWFDQCRSGTEFFYRPQFPEQFHRLAQVHLYLLKQLKQLFAEADRYGQKDAVRHKTELDAYKRHHQINSPGLRLMNRSFGAEWTQAYLADCLFA